VYFLILPLAAQERNAGGLIPTRRKKPPGEKCLKAYWPQSVAHVGIIIGDNGVGGHLINIREKSKIGSNDQVEVVDSQFLSNRGIRLIQMSFLCFSQSNSSI
jgi:hypothetical protein